MSRREMLERRKKEDAQDMHSKFQDPRGGAAAAGGDRAAETPAAAEAAIPVRNPRTGEVDHTVTPTSAADVKKAAAELRAAQPAWSAAGVAARKKVLLEWAGVLAEDKALLHALVTDTGRRMTSLVEVQASFPGMVYGAAERAERLLAEKPARGSVTPRAESVQISDQYDPLPLVGVISPWNFPLLLAMIDTLPALMAGCAVLLKPSEVTPRFAEPLVASLSRFPELAAVLRVVKGGPSTGAAVVDSVDAVAFTGSVRTGRIIAEAAARNFIPCFLELGGKDPLVVLAGADLEDATKVALRASVQATGQACQSLERIYVPHAVKDEFVALLAKKAAAVSLSYPDPEEGQLGPLIFAKQADTIREHIRDAVEKGARVLTGGEVEQLGGGTWVRPTVLVDVDHSMKVMTEETFGPLLPVMGYESIDEAIALANDSEYGLSAAVFGPDAEECRRVARGLKAGAVGINDGAMTAYVYDCPHTAYGYSGLGECRQGDSGLLRFVRRKAILHQTGVARAIEDNDERHSKGKL